MKTNLDPLVLQAIIENDEIYEQVADEAIDRYVAHIDTWFRDTRFGDF